MLFTSTEWLGKTVLSKRRSSQRRWGGQIGGRVRDERWQTRAAREEHRGSPETRFCAAAAGPGWVTAPAVSLPSIPAEGPLKPSPSTGTMPSCRRLTSPDIRSSSTDEVPSLDTQPAGPIQTFDECGALTHLSCTSPWHPVHTRFWHQVVLSPDFPFPALLDDSRAGNLCALSGAFMQQVFMEPLLQAKPWAWQLLRQTQSSAVNGYVDEWMDGSKRKWCCCCCLVATEENPD